MEENEALMNMSAMRKVDYGTLGEKRGFCGRRRKGLEEGDKGREEEKRREDGDKEEKLCHLRPAIPLGLPLRTRPPPKRMPSP